MKRLVIASLFILFLSLLFDMPFEQFVSKMKELATSLLLMDKKRGLALVATLAAIIYLKKRRTHSG